MAKELDFISAMRIIDRVEKSKFQGDRDFLILALGKETFKTMAIMGYINGGLRLENGKPINTYGVTNSFKSWNEHLSIGENAV